MGARCIYREAHGDTHLEIWEEDDRRSLWFDDVVMQTEIHIDDPAVLPNPVNRAMLAHLMYDPPLQRVMLAGCGGGAIARWLHARVPEVAGDAVELSPTVARLAREYFDFPPPESNWRLLIGDVREHLVLNEARYDFILVDLEEGQASPAWLTDSEFLHGCLRQLNPRGVVTLNLIVSSTAAAGIALQRIREVFSATVLIDDPEHDNLVVIAFPDAPPAAPTRQQLIHRGRRWGMDFVSLAQRATRIGSALAAAGSP